jgi:FKBP-type peptidyl-prolyl cis-trans isomerase SlyD
MTIKNNDFVKLDYVGRVDGKIFDLTKEDVAKKEGIFNEKTKYGPVTIVVGAGHLLKGIDEVLVGKDVGDSFSVDIEPEKAFGKKNAKLIKIIPERSFREQKVKPYPGMQVNIDGILGIVISAGGGRIIVDFNHPLAGKTLNYEISVLEKVEDKAKQVASLVEMYTNVKPEVEIAEDSVKIIMNEAKNLSEKAKTHIEEEIKKYAGLKKVEFLSKDAEEKTAQQ